MSWPAHDGVPHRLVYTGDGRGYAVTAHYAASIHFARNGRAPRTPKGNVAIMEARAFLVSYHTPNLALNFAR
jgi:hypothetical protein